MSENEPELLRFDPIFRSASPVSGCTLPEVPLEFADHGDIPYYEGDRWAAGSPRSLEKTLEQAGASTGGWTPI